MSAQSGVMVPCETLQARLTDYWSTCLDASEPLPLYEMLLSQENALESVVSPVDGKLRTVRLTYTPRILDSAVTTGASRTCTATTKRGNRWTDYTIDTTATFQIEELFTLDDFKRICESNDNIFAEKIAKMLDALDRKAAYSLSAQAVVLAGSWGSDVTADDASGNLEVRTLRSGTTDSLAPMTMQEISTAAEQSGYCMPYAIFGGVTLRDYARAMQLGCCTDYGMDLAAMFSTYGVAVGYDRALVSAFGSQAYSLMVMQGALQVLTYNEYGLAPWASFDAGNEKIMKVYTRRGLPVDMVIRWSCGNWHVVLTANAQVKAMPYDMWAAGDIFNGVNFVNKIEVVNS